MELRGVSGVLPLEGTSPPCTHMEENSVFLPIHGTLPLRVGFGVLRRGGTIQDVTRSILYSSRARVEHKGPQPQVTVKLLWVWHSDSRLG